MRRYRVTDAAVFAPRIRRVMTKLRVAKTGFPGLGRHLTATNSIALSLRSVCRFEWRGLVVALFGTIRNNRRRVFGHRMSSRFDFWAGTVFGQDFLQVIGIHGLAFHEIASHMFECLFLRRQTVQGRLHAFIDDALHFEVNFANRVFAMNRVARRSRSRQER